MRRSSEFASVVRSGDRARRGHVVVHRHSSLRRGGPVVVGLVVGKSVGGSVARHQVSRRLRAKLAQRLDVLAQGAGFVVRALPGSAEVTSAELGADLDAALSRLERSR
ncbi:MAG: ribonuclease P protein component [Actinomycetota bacterium]|nr:ribonuclease P protein component [Actinomycetota bacterium]